MNEELQQALTNLEDEFCNCRRFTTSDRFWLGDHEPTCDLQTIINHPSATYGWVVVNPDGNPGDVLWEDDQKDQATREAERWYGKSWAELAEMGYKLRRYRLEVMT
jgi:hypothetical protein